MQILSDGFLEKLYDAILDRVDKLLANIERRYVVRARHLSKKSACIYADISKPTLDKWLAKGLPISKIDGCFRIDSRDIDDFMDKHKIRRGK